MTSSARKTDRLSRLSQDQVTPASLIATPSAASTIDASRLVMQAGRSGGGYRTVSKLLATAGLRDECHSVAVKPELKPAQFKALIAALSWYARPEVWEYQPGQCRTQARRDAGLRARLALQAVRVGAKGQDQGESEPGPLGLDSQPVGSAPSGSESGDQTTIQAQAGGQPQRGQPEAKKESLPGATPGGHATHPESRARKRFSPRTITPVTPCTGNKTKDS